MNSKHETGYGHHRSPFWKMTLFSPCMKFDFFFGQIPSLKSVMKVLFCDYIQNMSQAQPKCLFKWMKWIISNSNHNIWNFLFFWIPISSQLYLSMVSISKERVLLVFRKVIVIMLVDFLSLYTIVKLSCSVL